MIAIMMNESKIGFKTSRMKKFLQAVAFSEGFIMSCGFA
jgi:hypothetical protein